MSPGWLFLCLQIARVGRLGFLLNRNADVCETANGWFLLLLAMFLDGAGVSEFEKPVGRLSKESASCVS